MVATTSRVRRRTGRHLITLLVIVVGLLASACLPAQAGNITVRHSLFGLHDATDTQESLGKVHEGWVRLWDAGVEWDQIETSPGHYDWSRLDSLVATARSHHAAITMVVAMTPSFYSHTPTNVPASAISHYKTFVSKLMHRYRGRIDSYQVWNESNITTFWTGSQHRMAQLTKTMYDVRNAVDRKAEVVAPPMVTRLGFELKGIKAYNSQKLGGTPVWRYYDVAALSLYPLPRYGRRAGVPEDSVALLDAAKEKLRAAGVPASKTIWDTEINYGLQSGSNAGTAAARISASRQAANVVRTYLLQAADNVRRIAWYRYDWGRISARGGTIGNTLLTNPDNVHRLTAAGRAYLMVQRWMHGTLKGSPGHRPCSRNTHGTYTCVVSDSSGTRRIYWNPFHSAKVTVSGGARHKQNVLGAISRVQGGATISVDYRPVMVYR
jgi:polysaccharide biosynthesis protein PslG